MSSYYEKETSLHSLLLSSAAPPEYIQVKPKGFRAILQSTVEFLEAHQIKANLFVKLPTGDPWKADIQRYGQGLAAPNHVFRFVRGETPPPSHPAEVVVPLGNAALWQGDYFLVIQADSFASLVVAHRIQPRSAGGRDDDDPGAPVEGAGLAQRPSYLSVCCSINPSLVARVMAALGEQVAQIATAVTSSAAVVALAREWPRYGAAVDITCPDCVDRVDKWLNWQLRHQEHLRQASSTYRRQAMGLASLSSQNEVLINTLRLKDDFLNTVGQELRTPLTTIKTALTLLDSPHLKPPQRQRYMEMISHECDRQSALIRGVLNLLQMETSVSQAQAKSLRLADTVPPVVSTYQPLAEEKGVMLAYTIPSTIPAVACPDAWLRQVMIHLLNNSLKYTPSGGEVWVTARHTQEFAEIEVRDTGIGISPSDLPNIFEHFYRGRNLPANETEGAGLGLSIVQQLLMYCGGSIVVTSQGSQGTTFTVRLPLHEG